MRDVLPIDRFEDPSTPLRFGRDDTFPRHAWRCKEDQRSTRHLYSILFNSRLHIDEGSKDLSVPLRSGRDDILRVTRPRHIARILAAPHGKQKIKSLCLSVRVRLRSPGSRSSSGAGRPDPCSEHERLGEQKG